MIPTWQCPRCCSILGVTITIFPRHVIAIRNPLISFIKDSALEWLILSWHGLFVPLKTVYAHKRKTKRKIETNFHVFVMQMKNQHLPYSMRRPCAENRKMPVLSMRFDEPATFLTRPASSWIDLFNLSRRFFSARLRASRPLLLWMYQKREKMQC